MHSSIRPSLSLRYAICVVDWLDGSFSFVVLIFDDGFSLVLHARSISPPIPFLLLL